MKLGDVVEIWQFKQFGLVVGFNEKGHGGKDFVHVLVGGDIKVFMEFDLKVVRNGSRRFGEAPR